MERNARNNDNTHDRTEMRAVLPSSPQPREKDGERHGVGNETSNGWFFPFSLSAWCVVMFQMDEIESS